MRIPANGLALEVDDQGPPGGEPVLLIMGLGMQLVAWPQLLVNDLVRRGFRVIRFDNRDIGLSEGLDALGVPSVSGAAMRHALHLPIASPYTLRDMALDAQGVLQALGIGRAHVVGASMGGMIAQHLAVMAPQMVRSLGLIMTSSGARHLPRPHWRVQQAMLQRPSRQATIEQVAEHQLRLLQLIGSPGYPPADPAQRRSDIEAMLRRSYRPAGTLRQLLAIMADGDRSPLLPLIEAPTAVIHGAEDPLVPPACGQDLARKIRGATLELIPGMGHDLPQALMGRLGQMLADLAGSAPRG